MFSIKKKLKRGLTLIEAAMVLAISTLVVAGVMVLFQSASTNSKTNEVIYVPAHRKTHFKPSKLLKSFLRQPLED